MFSLASHVIAFGLLASMLALPAVANECEHASADERAMARLLDATRDYVAFGRTAPFFTPEVAEILRFQLRLTRWLHRYDATETPSDLSSAKPVTNHEAAGLLDALPRLPDQLEYRFHRRHLLLIDRRTRTVLDVLEDALGR